MAFYCYFKASEGSSTFSLQYVTESESDRSWVGPGNKANTTTGVSGYHGYRQAEETVGKRVYFGIHKTTTEESS